MGNDKKNMVQIEAEALEMIKPIIRDALHDMEIRICDVCGKAFVSGALINDEYFCSEECARTRYSKKEELLQMYEMSSEDEEMLLSSPMGYDELADYLEKNYEASLENYWSDWEGSQELCDMVNRNHLI